MKKLLTIAALLLFAATAGAQVPARSFSILGGPVAHDSPAASFWPLLIGCHASAAAPSDVSADNDAVRAWCLRNGARIVGLQSAGTLVALPTALGGSGGFKTEILGTLPAFASIPTFKTDQTAHGTTDKTAADLYLGGSAVSASNPVPTAGANSNAKINCTNNAFLNMTTATTTEIVALSGSTIIYVCSYSIVSNGGTATNVKFVGGTGTNCATSQDDRSAGIPLTAATNTVGIARGSGEGMILKTSTAGDALCVTSSGAATIGVDISYAQF